MSGTEIELSSTPVPKGIRLSVVNDPRNSIAVSWYTETKASSPKVYYATNPSLTNPSEKDATEILLESSYVYSAEISDLTENTTYYYKVMTDTTIYNFTTAADRDMDNGKII